MFVYTEEKRIVPADKYNDAYTERLIYISDGEQKIGRIEAHYDLSGKLIPTDYWKKDRPVLVEAIDIAASRRDGCIRRDNLDYCRTVAEGKKIFDGKPVLGGFDNRPNTLLYTGSDEDVRKEVIRILDEAGEAGVGIGADCTIGDDVPKARYEFIRNVSKDYFGRR